MVESAIYEGKVLHARHRPTQHKFSYDITLFWLKLSELEQLNASLPQFSIGRKNWLEFRRKDYLGHADTPLDKAVLQRMSELQGNSLDGDVFFLGQMRSLGFYFSPVNFYFLRQLDGSFTHMLAEVSNTPWNERHHYLVDLKTQSDTEKAFFVSPFNPMSMTYKWRIARPGENTFTLTLSCWQAQKEFSASLSLSKVPLNSSTLKRVIWSTPSMTIKSVLGIYWQALKLWMKKTPIYKHSIVEQQETK